MSNDLEKRIQRLEDERSITETITLYGHYVDYGLKEEFADLFTEDGIYHVMYRGATMPHIGVPQEKDVGIKTRAKILEFVKNHTMPPALWHKHVPWNPVIKIESDQKASSVTYMARLDEDAEGPYILCWGRYLDEFEKCPDGKWRFSKRVVETESRFPFKRMGGKA